MHDAALQYMATDEHATLTAPTYAPLTVPAPMRTPMCKHRAPARMVACAKIATAALGCLLYTSPSPRD
eukprot:11999560-Alexandrium_andersonii.AAC.1